MAIFPNRTVDNIGMLVDGVLSVVILVFGLVGMPAVILQMNLRSLSLHDAVTLLFCFTLFFGSAAFLNICVLFSRLEKIRPRAASFEGWPVLAYLPVVGSKLRIHNRVVAITTSGEYPLQLTTHAKVARFMDIAFVYLLLSTMLFDLLIQVYSQKLR